VDFDARGIRLRGEDVKDKEDAFLPGGKDAMQFLNRLVNQAKDRKTRYLFTWRQPFKDQKRQAVEPWVPIKSPRKAWQTAMAVIEEKFGARWRWHDIRAAFITHVAISSGGVIAQKLARHSDFATTQSYIEVADEATRAAADRIANHPSLGAVRGGKR
jgi:site-specific recombinase XerD